MSPLPLFLQWYEQATAKEPSDPGAMTLATVDADGQPSARIVLMRAVDEDGFSFFTNYQSLKAREIEQNPNAAICFHWKSLSRQVRARGKVIKLPESASDDYFQSRPYESRIGAWASLQSGDLPSKNDLQKRFDEFRAKYPQNVPRPDFWGGYKLLAEEIEFWQEAPHRLHDRELFIREGGAWRSKRLYP